TGAPCCLWSAALRPGQLGQHVLALPSAPSAAPPALSAGTVHRVDFC
ncbi:hypothetical protein A2U01_0067388, partial [Trifolium medium]|nr:hypothetical protein [Trifolium medium]